MTYRSRGLIILALLIFSCDKQKEKVDGEVTLDPKEITNNYVNSGHIIEAVDLLTFSKQENVKIINFSKSQDYAKAHITGALNIWRTDIEDLSYPYSGMMAKKELIEELFSRLGIRNDDVLVIYDNKGSSDSARLWWLLKNYDFESVKILNGGLKEWKKAGGSISSKETKVAAPSEFSLLSNSSLDLLVNKSEMIDIVASKGSELILDTRSKDEFSGKRQKTGATQAGRIPKSIHIDWAEAIDYEGTKKFRSLEELERIYNRMGVSKTDPIIVYCHTGVRSAHTTFVLTELLGYKNVKNYDGSWTEWSHFDELPFEKDSLTTIKN